MAYGSPSSKKKKCSALRGLFKKGAISERELEEFKRIARLRRLQRKKGKVSEKQMRAFGQLTAPDTALSAASALQRKKGAVSERGLRALRKKK